ncbi:TPA: tight adherence pilus pseudopilin TadF [Yersinia enterocolitica]
MCKNINHQNLLSNTQGAVIVEFSFIIFIIVIFIKVLISISEYYSTIGKLDRISYSLAGVIRERTRLYYNDRELTQLQVDQLQRLANNMLANPGSPPDNLKIKIETVHFNSTQSSTAQDKIIDNAKSLSFSSGGDCEPDQPLRELSELSSFSNAGRWIPLYQVTLCLPANAWYHQLFSQEGNAISIKSSSITIER